MKLVGRGDTTVVDAYLSPILKRYVDRIAGQLEGTKLYFMQSNGGLVDAAAFRGKDCILSGPAGGVVGAVATVAGDGRDVTDSSEQEQSSAFASQGTLSLEARHRAIDRLFGQP